MDQTVKDFLQDKNNPSILNEYFEDVYRYYSYSFVKTNKKSQSLHQFLIMLME